MRNAVGTKVNHDSHLAVGNDGATHCPLFKPAIFFVPPGILHSVFVLLPLATVFNACTEQYANCLSTPKVKPNCSKIFRLLKSSEYQPHATISAVQGWDEGDKWNQPAYSEQQHAVKEQIWEILLRNTEIQ